MYVLWYYLFSRLSNFRVFRAMADARIEDRAKGKPQRHNFRPKVLSSRLQLV